MPEYGHSIRALLASQCSHSVSFWFQWDPSLLHTSLYTPCLYVHQMFAQCPQKTEEDIGWTLPPPELELIVLSCHVGPRNWIQILCRNSKRSSLLGPLCSPPPIAFLKWQRFQGSLNADWQPNDFYAFVCTRHYLEWDICGERSIRSGWTSGAFMLQFIF